MTFALSLLAVALLALATPEALDGGRKQYFSPRVDPLQLSLLGTCPLPKREVFTRSPPNLILPRGRTGFNPA